jgi:hypothetical protein
VYVVVWCCRRISLSSFLSLDRDDNVGLSSLSIPFSWVGLPIASPHLLLRVPKDDEERERELQGGWWWVSVEAASFNKTTTSRLESVFVFQCSCVYTFFFNVVFIFFVCCSRRQSHSYSSSTDVCGDIFVSKRWTRQT